MHLLVIGNKRTQGKARSFSAWHGGLAWRASPHLTVRGAATPPHCTASQSTADRVRFGAPHAPQGVFNRLMTSGAFYPAADFRLHGRAPLPFAPSLALSRNHFNLQWVGDRRLKNSIVVLEWVPSGLRGKPLFLPRWLAS